MRAAREYRLIGDRPMSQLELATRVGVYATLLSKIENNDRTKRDCWTSFLGRILDALNTEEFADIIAADYLLGRDDKMTRPREAKSVRRPK